jgi:transposase InsO family protein
MKLGRTVHCPERPAPWMRKFAFRRTPVRAPKANASCERFGGTLRRECLDFVIPLNERHLKMTVQQWGNH